MGTPFETFLIAQTGDRVPIGVVAGIAWLESKWDPEARTGRHVGLFQLVDAPKDSIYGDWLAAGGPEVSELTDPDGNASIAGWGLVRVADQIRKVLRKYGITLPDTVFWPLVYWAWLAGTSDVPKVLAAYAKWVSRDRRSSVLPLLRAWEEATTRLTTEGKLWSKYQALQTAERWSPERIRQVLETGAIKPKLTADFVLNKRKAGYAFRLGEWVRLSWEQILKKVGPEFEKFYGRSPTSDWVRGAKAGALLAALLIGYLLLRR